MKKLIALIICIIIIIISSMIGYLVVSANTKVKTEESIIDRQNEIQKDFKIYGYTLENPNLIINPYDISPLTALIIFETEKEEEVTLIIKGKNAEDITNTFEKNTKHYIPVYGLYPDYENKIIIQTKDNKKELTIKTDKLPDIFPEIEKNNNEGFLFITSDTIPYAIDNNNEVRWYLTKNYKGNIDVNNNNNLILSSDRYTEDNYYTGLIEIDYLGKIHKEYQLDTGYCGNYKLTNDSIIIQSNKIIELDLQTGTILDGDKDKDVLDKENNKKELKLYYNNNNYKIEPGYSFRTKTITPTISKKIILINYKNIDKSYKKYNINIIQEKYRLKISGNFNEEDKVYIVLDKFLDKKVYELTNKKTGTKYINKEGLSGKYSVYIKINENLYKTNKYIVF